MICSTTCDARGEHGDWNDAPAVRGAVLLRTGHQASSWILRAANQRPEAGPLKTRRVRGDRAAGEAVHDDDRGWASSCP